MCKLLHWGLHLTWVMLWVLKVDRQYGLNLSLKSKLVLSNFSEREVLMLKFPVSSSFCLWLLWICDICLHKCYLFLFGYYEIRLIFFLPTSFSVKRGFIIFIPSNACLYLKPRTYQTKKKKENWAKVDPKWNSDVPHKIFFSQAKFKAHFGPLLMIW